jgi:hypothetical protein
MADFDDLRLDKPPIPPPPPQPRWVPLAAAAVLLIALAAVWYYLRRGADGDQAQPRSATEQSIPQRPGLIEEPAANPDLPPLDESDAFVRDLVRALSEHPIVAAWLTSDQLIRTFTVSVMNVAEGDTPSRHLYTIRPEDRFQTRTRGAGTYIDARSYARFDGHAAAVAGLDPAGAARLYQTLKPRIDEAYREIAGPDAVFDRALERAIVELLGTPVVEGEVAVEPRTVGYGYADPSLESLSRAQQQLLRIGPRNVRAVQEKLRAVAGQLGISEASLPRERIVQTGR